MKDKENYSKEEVYSILSQLQNELNDDLVLDLGKGEFGYKSYEESYNAVKKFTLRKLNKMANRVRRQILRRQRDELRTT